MDIKEFSKLNGMNLEVQKVQHNTWMQFNQIKKNVSEQNEANAKTITGIDSQLTTINAKIAAISASIVASPINDGAFFAFSPALNNFPIVITHPLGRTPVGFILTKYTSPLIAGGFRIQVQGWDAANVTFLVDGTNPADVLTIWIF
jgi:hypothetical protein